MSEMETLAATTSQSMSKTLKRKPKNKSKKPNKKLKRPQSAAMAGATKRKKPTKRLLQLFQKRAKKYNSDSESEEEEDEEEEGEKEREYGLSGSEGEEEERGSGITKFSEGCNAFKVAFLKIMKKSEEFTDPLGPILSGHKNLVATKLAEEEEEHKPKGDNKKDKQLAKEKGHVKPESYLDAKEKLLISIATKGVVRLFNAVSKAQNPQKGLNPSLSKDAKALAKHRKQTFLSELKKPSVSSVDEEANKVGWAPLRDSYMLGSKLKDWDKMPDTNEGGEKDGNYMQSSSDEDSNL
ncbi:hypothetical protein LUZ60_016078 [Juncus effusus]|nr:hypothetical protein LUZ60_016078 [Juncus effusus]